jgi:hypothetical protein
VVKSHGAMSYKQVRKSLVMELPEVYIKEVEK